ncbi:MAG: competence/damage-inducible protein A [Clostridia bacterium]|nr:competence/damage-inducible protein A [Clostridia bacterium]
MKAEIIAVGTELLLGQIVNTNARDLAAALSDCGVIVYYQTVVGDNPGRLKDAIKDAYERVDLVILTGGLGPTKDDLTKEIIAQYFGKKLVLDQPSLDRIKGYFDRMGREKNETNEKQAYMPEGCIILENDCGTAPGLIVEEGEKIAILLPGPPKEMNPMFENKVKPWLSEKTGSTIKSRTLKMIDIGESNMAAAVSDLMDGENPTVAPYAKEGESELRITAMAKTEEEADKLIEPVAKEIYARLGEYIYGEDDTTLVEALVKKLIDKKLTISTAESCTGGLIASEITSVAGSSEIFGSGYVTYANSAKMKMLGVKDKTLADFGAVSGETAKEMAEGARAASGADIAVSVTGIAGPGGGSAEKPVGLVYTALADDDGTIVKKLNLDGSRDKVRGRTVKNVLKMVIQRIDEKGDNK